MAESVAGVQKPDEEELFTPGLVELGRRLVVRHAGDMHVGDDILALGAWAMSRAIHKQGDAIFTEREFFRVMHASLCTAYRLGTLISSHATTPVDLEALLEDALDED